MPKQLQRWILGEAAQVLRCHDDFCNDCAQIQHFLAMFATRIFIRTLYPLERRIGPVAACRRNGLQNARVACSAPEAAANRAPTLDCIAAS